MKHILPILSILCLATACAKTSSVTQSTLCPQTFVAKPFARLTLIDELRDTRNNLSFAKVRALCKQDEQQTTFLKLSFVLQLDKPLPEIQRKTPLLIPLFAALTKDGETLSSRQSQRLRTTFDKKGRAQTSWLVALPPAPLSPSATSAAASTLYLGFEGDTIALRKLRLTP